MAPRIGWGLVVAVAAAVVAVAAGVGIGYALWAEPDYFAATDASKYDGWVGAEYRPPGSTSAGLGWMEAVED